MIKTVLLGVGTKLLTSLLTEKVIINLVVLLLTKAVEKWGNPLAKDLLNLVTEALENPVTRPVAWKQANTNLYAEVKTKCIDGQCEVK